MDNKYSKTLWIKSAITMLGFAIVPLFILWMTVNYWFQVAYEEIIMDTLQTSALYTRDAVQFFLDERVSQLSTLAETYSLNQLNNDPANLDEVLSGVKSASRFFSAIEIVDNRGNRIESAGPREVEPLAKANGDWYGATLSSGVYISDVFTDRGNVRYFFIAVPLPNNKQWILRAIVEAKALDEIVGRAQIGKLGHAFIVNKNNLPQTAPSAGAINLETPGSPVISLPTGNHVAQIHYRGEDSFVAVTHFKNLGWALVAIENCKEQMTPLSSTRYTGGLVAAGGVLFILAGAILSLRSIAGHSARPVRRAKFRNDSETGSSKMVAVGRMAAGIAHEVNNPLAIIGGMAGWMKDLLDEQDIRASRNLETYRECITKIEGEVRRCKTVTHRLLSFGRGITPDSSVIDVNHLLAEVASLLESEAYFRDIAMHATYGDGLPKITADATKLQQVFFDVFDESIDVVGKFGSIDVDTSFDIDSNELRLRIARISSASHTTKPGEGIAAPVGVDASQTGSVAKSSASHRILAKLGGRITVTEPAAGQTIFTISLPAPTPSDLP